MRRTVVAMLAATTVAAVLPAALASPNAKPAFVSYRAPEGVGDDAGEPTLGWIANGNVVLFASGSRTLRITGFDGHGRATWRDVSPVLPGAYTFDPILETDTKTGRTWTSQLDLYCSRMAFTDDAGATWTQLPAGCGPGAAFDHQSVGFGPWVQGNGLPRLNDYPNAVYYCAQSGATAMCGTSVDGGFTFLPARLAYNVADCDTAFGHLKSSRSGTVFLPSFSCNGLAGLARSKDNGQTWQVRTVPGSRTNGSAMHPSLATGSDGTLYFAWGGVDGAGPGGAPYVAVSRDEASTWTKPYRLGTEYGIVSTRFPTVVAGDGDRAAVAYLGTSRRGNGSDPAFDGVWHLYVSFTYDRGKHWSTVDATPNAAVQVGPICTDGALCTADRNLLDFNDSVLDGRGRVLVAMADGCTVAVCTRTARESKATIVRQESGRGLYRKYDPH